MKFEVEFLDCSGNISVTQKSCVLAAPVQTVLMEGY